MATPHKLTLVPYLQHWDHAARVLSIRLLVTPAADPLMPLVPAPPGVPAFADARWSFAVSISDSVDALPMRSDVSQLSVVPDPGSGAPTIAHANARKIFAAIKVALEIPDTVAADTFTPQQRDAVRQLHKYLPESYRRSFAFVQPRTSLAVTDDSYRCLVGCPPAPRPPLPEMVIGWGEALAFAMRQPRLAEALGLVVPLDVPLAAAPRLAHGGWLWVDLAAGSDYATEAGTPGFLRSFATRVPELPTGTGRPVFTPVIFPVSADATEAGTLGNFDKVFVEAVRFDDGFSKIVHARQPLSADVLDERGTGAPIARDEGIQLGWDDEDVLEGQNRSLGQPPDGEDPVLAPRGVFGYRVDVRPANTSAWTSLSRVQAPLDIGVDLGTALEERWSEVAPTDHGDELWLPAWFVNWRGGTLVVSTVDDQRLMNVPPGRPVTTVPVDADAVELRYGQRYEFRVRLADTTGGGPDLGMTAIRDGESPTALIHMKRRRAPGPLDIDPVTPAADGSVSSIRVWRPRLGYPEAVFAAGGVARTALLAQIAANDAGNPADAKAPTIADPDTAFVRIRVLLRLPALDPAADGGGFVEWYTTSRAFPADPSQPLALALDWIPAADYTAIDTSSQIGAEGTISGAIPVLRARDVRLEISALGRNDLTYFATPDARLGAIRHVDLHAIADVTEETDIVRRAPAANTLRSIFLQPDAVGARAAVLAVVAQNDPSPVLLARLAAAADLASDGTMLLGRDGERVAFGCAGLTHHAAPDLSSLEVAHPPELAGQWLNVLQLVLDRDWTWRGAGSPSVEISRTVSLPAAPGVADETADVGTIELMNTINTQAARAPDRTHTRIIFLDALPPRLALDGLPYEMAITYQYRLRFEGGGSQQDSIATRLPIATAPRQVPVVVAAGWALTPYEQGAEYASTSPRTRRLWIEFDAPPADPRDAYFVRPVTSTPDPMLLPGWEPLADPVVLEATPLDPELVRVITPGQVKDLAGLATMQRLEPSPTSPRHFVVPLPPNTNPGSPDLLSFYSYEIRLGHDRGVASDPLWCTAQARFGETLLLDGVQHPAPELPCSVHIEPDDSIRIRAPYATPYVGLRRAIPTPPNTQIWAVLYARVVQADATTRRNVQVDLRQLPPVREHRIGAPLIVAGEARWSQLDVQGALATAGLPLDSPLSALAVELLPEPNGGFDDPLGGDLGQVRILRTSPLSSIDRSCCS